MPSNLTKSTAATIQLGPFLDKTDGVTPETGLTPVIEISKAGGAFAARNSGDAVAHDTEGWYRIPLDTTDTNTLGSLIVQAQDGTNHLAVWRELEIVSEQEDICHVSQTIGMLRRNTARQIVVGPFISRATKLPLTSLTVGDITCGIIKEGSPPTNTAITLTAAAGINDFVHLANGYWRVELTTTDTNSDGEWAMTFRDDDVFYPVTVRSQCLQSSSYLGLLDTDTGLFSVNVLEIFSQTPSLSANNNLEVDVQEIDGSLAKAFSLSNAIDTGNDVVDANTRSISGDFAAADNLEAACDGTTYNIGGGATTVDVTKISGDSTAADRMEAIMDGSPNFAVDDTAFAPTTTAFETTATEATADHYKDRRVLFTAGALLGQYKACTAYSLVGGRGRFTVDALSDAPLNGDPFILV